MFGYAGDAENLRKCDLIDTKVHFCGRIIDAKAVTFHHGHYNALTSLEATATVGALMERRHGANWMTTAKPRFSGLIEPRHKLLEDQ